MVLHGTNDSGGQTKIKTEEDGDLRVSLRASGNSAGTGTHHHLTCDTGGRLYINSDLGIPINALTAGGALQSLRCEDGALKCAVVSSITKDETSASSSGVIQSFAQNNTSTHLTLPDDSKYVRLLLNGSTSSFLSLWLEGSADNAFFVPLKQITPINIGSNYYGSELIERPPKYIRIKNHDISSASFKWQFVYGK